MLHERSVSTSGEPASGNQPWVEKALLQLDRISRLAPGWDANGAPSPDENLVRAGRSLLLLLWASRQPSRPIGEPHVSPTRAGGVQFEWENEGRYFEVEITTEEQATWFFQDLSARIEEEGIYSKDESPAELLAYIERTAAP